MQPSYHRGTLPFGDFLMPKVRLFEETGEAQKTWSLPCRLENIGSQNRLKSRLSLNAKKRINRLYLATDPWLRWVFLSSSKSTKLYYPREYSARWNTTITTPSNFTANYRIVTRGLGIPGGFFIIKAHDYEPTWITMNYDETLSQKGLHWSLAVLWQERFFVHVYKCLCKASLLAPSRTAA